MAFPIVPLVWLLIAIYRALKGRGGNPPAGQRRAAAEITGPLGVSRGFYIALYLSFITLPLGLFGMALAGEESDNLSLALLAGGLCVYASFQGPHWLAWRVLAPRGWIPRGQGGALAGVPSEPRRSERSGSAPRGRLRPGLAAGSGQGDGLDGLRSGSRGRGGGSAARGPDPLRIHRFGKLPRNRLRTQGVELVAWPALRRHDWRRVQRRVEEGRGRGVRLLGLIARAHLDAPPRSPFFWLAWALAPNRRATLPYVREALAARRKRGPASRPSRPVRQGRPAASGCVTCGSSSGPPPAGPSA